MKLIKILFFLLTLNSFAYADKNMKIGSKGNIIWKFDNAVNIEVACNVPDHYQAGMIAKVNTK